MHRITQIDDLALSSFSIPRDHTYASRLSHNKPCDWANENEGEKKQREKREN